MDFVACNKRQAWLTKFFCPKIGVANCPVASCGISALGHGNLLTSLSYCSDQMVMPV